MKRTKLGDYIAILQLLLINQRPLQFYEIEGFMLIEKNQLEEDLSFLLKQNAIRRDPSSSTRAYMASPLGDKLVRYFGRSFER